MNVSYSTSLVIFAQPTSPSVGYVPYPTWLIAFLWILTSVFCIETTLGNLLVLCAYKLERNIRRHLSNKFIVSLAVSDLIIGMEGFPMLTVYVVERERWPLGDIMCKIWLCVDYTLCLVSILTVLLITVDRYCSVCYPASYRAWQTRKKVRAMIVLSWIVPFLLFAIMIFGWETMTKEKTKKDPEKCSAPFLSDPYVNMSMYIAYYWTTLAAMSVLYRGIHKAAKTLEQKSKAREKQTIALLLGQRCMAQVGVGILMRAESPSAAEQKSKKDKIEFSKFQQDYDTMVVPESGYITACEQICNKNIICKDVTFKNIKDIDSLIPLKDVNETNKEPTTDVVNLETSPRRKEESVDESAIREQMTSSRNNSPKRRKYICRKTCSNISLRMKQTDTHCSWNSCDSGLHSKSRPSNDNRSKKALHVQNIEGSISVQNNCKSKNNSSLDFQRHQMKFKRDSLEFDNRISSSFTRSGCATNPKSFCRKSSSNFSLQIKQPDSFCSLDLWDNASSCNNSLFADMTFTSLFEFDQVAYETSNASRKYNHNQINNVARNNAAAEKTEVVCDSDKKKSYGTCPVLPSADVDENIVKNLTINNVDSQIRRLSSSTTAPVAINHLILAEKPSLDEKAVSAYCAGVKPVKMTYRDSWQATLCDDDKVRLMKLKSGGYNLNQTVEDEESVGSGSNIEELDEPSSIEKRTGSWVSTLFTNPTWLLHKKRKVTKAEKRARKAFRTITVIVGTFALFWSPYFIVATIYGFCPKCVPSPLFFTSYYLCYLNSSVNPFAYAFANRLFRKTFLRILRGDFRRT